MPSIQVLIAPFILYVIVSGGLAYLVVRLVETLFKVAPRVRMALYASALVVPVVSYVSYFTHILGPCSNVYSPYNLRICTVARQYSQFLGPFTALVLVPYLGVRFWQLYTSPIRDGAVVENAAMVERVRNMVRELGGSEDLSVVLYNNHYPAAYVRGLRRAEICLTTGLIEQLDDGELRATIAHELAHIKGRDNLYNVIFLLKEIAFFAPLSHLAYARYCQAREEAADLAVPEELRLDLASALLKVVRRSEELVRFTKVRWSESFIIGGGDVTRRMELLIDERGIYTAIPVWGPMILLGLVVLLIC